MQKIMIYVIVLFISISIINSCKKNPNTSDILTDVICPLEVGNYWTYQDSVWHYAQGYFRYLKDRKVEITGTTITTIDDNEYQGFLWNNINTETMTPSDFKTIIVNESDGLWKLGAQISTDSLISKSMWIKYPVEVGDTWPMQIFSINSQDEVYVRDNVIVQCIAKDEIFATQAGDYNCIVYKYYEPMYGDDTYLYFVPNIGMVGRIVQKDGKEPYIRRRMTFYQIN